MLTIGYGDNVPRTSQEKILTIFFILGACNYYYIFKVYGSPIVLILLEVSSMILLKIKEKEIEE